MLCLTVAMKAVAQKFRLLVGVLKFTHSHRSYLASHKIIMFTHGSAQLHFHAHSYKNNYATGTNSILLCTGLSPSGISMEPITTFEVYPLKLL